MRTISSIFLLVFSLYPILTASAYELDLYYDPGTGNVSFDTANTRSGEIITYSLNIYEDLDALGFRYRPENHLQITNSPYIISEEDNIGLVTFEPISGLYTIGDILPSGLPETAWTTLYLSPTGNATYSPGVGLPHDDPVNFIYGLPDRPFDNRWDLVDLDLLDWATSASLIYREYSGEVLLDTRGANGGHISGFYMRSFGDFIFDSFTPPWNSPLIIQDASNIDLLGNAIEPGIYSLGNILESGLSRIEYESIITEAKFLGRQSYGLVDLDLVTDGQSFNLIFEAVPEPSSAMLVSLGCMALLYRRNRACNR